MSEKTPVLEVKDLGIDFGGLTAVNDFNMQVFLWYVVLLHQFFQFPHGIH